jgi:predicted nucleic acid-binding protein
LILIDANPLIHAKFSDLPQHVRARAWLEGQTNAPGKVGIPWQTSLAFLAMRNSPVNPRRAIPYDEA